MASTFMTKLRRIEVDLGRVKNSYDETVRRLMQIEVVPSSPDNVEKFKEIHARLAEIQVKLEYLGKGKNFDENLEKAKIQDRVDTYMAYTNSHLRIYDHYL